MQYDMDYSAGKSIAEAQAEDDQRSIKYRPQYTAITGSVTSAILLQQIFFWYQVYGQRPFFKFNGPCKHAWYKETESWTEELGFTPSEFKGALNRIARKVTQGMSREVAMQPWHEEIGKDKFVEHPAPFVLYWTDGARVTWYEIMPAFYAAVGNAYTRSKVRNPHLAQRPKSEKVSYHVNQESAFIYTESATEREPAPDGALADEPEARAEQPVTPSLLLVNSEEPQEPENIIQTESAVLLEKIREPAEPRAAVSESRAMFAALRDVCRVNGSIKRGQLNQAAKRLRGADVTADEVRALYGEGGIWYREHWKGKRNEPPGIEDVCTWIEQAREAEAMNSLARVVAMEGQVMGAGRWA